MDCDRCFVLETTATSLGSESAISEGFPVSHAINGICDLIRDLAEWTAKLWVRSPFLTCKLLALNGHSLFMKKTTGPGPTWMASEAC